MGHIIGRHYSPIKIREEDHAYPLILKSLNMIDHETYWFDTIKYKDKQADTIKT